MVWIPMKKILMRMETLKWSRLIQVYRKSVGVERLLVANALARPRSVGKSGKSAKLCC